MQPSTRPSDELSESGALAEARTLRAPRESGKMRERRAPKFRLDHKVAHRRNPVLVIPAHVASPGPADHRACRKRSIQSDKLWHTRAEDRFSAGRSRRCI